MSIYSLFKMQLKVFEIYLFMFVKLFSTIFENWVVEKKLICKYSVNTSRYDVSIQYQNPGLNA